MIVAVGVRAAIATFCLLRFPRFRRKTFGQYAAFVLALAALRVLAQAENNFVMINEFI